MIYKGRTGQQYNLESNPFAQGGEGKIYNVVGRQDIVAKLYKNGINDSAKERKLIKMVNNPPKDVMSQIAWPLDILYDSSRAFVGFIMPKLAKKEDLNVIYEYGDTAKYKNLPWNFKIIAAKNLCAVLDAVHEAGHVVGDLNPKNISIDPQNGRVAFFDADSFHIIDNSVVYRCNVGMPEYLPVEIQRKMKHGNTLKTAPLPTFTEESDNFALAIHIFQLLMNGTHPFACRVLPSQASVVFPQPSDNILNGVFPFMQPNTKIDIPVYAPPIDILPQRLQNLFRQAFIDGHSNPARRPKPEEWHSALCELERELATCTARSNHKYYKFLSQCPWCQIDNRFTSMGKKRGIIGGSYTPPVAPGPLHRPQPKPKAITFKKHPVVGSFSVLIPIVAFIIGQVVQYILYADKGNVLIMSQIFGEIPLVFLVVSSVLSVVLTAMIVFNAWQLIKRDMIARSRLLFTLSSAFLIAIPCFSGSIGLIIYPIVTVVLAIKYYRLTEAVSKIFSIALPIIIFIIGQIAQYYVYLQSDTVLITDLIFGHTHLAILIISTILGAIGTGLECYSCWKLADKSNESGSWALLIPFSLLYGICPCVTGYGGIVLLPIIAKQVSIDSEDYISIAPTIASFIVGQIVLYGQYVRTGDVFLLTNFIELSGNQGFNILAFLISTSVIGAAATGIMAYIGYYFIYDDEIVNAYLAIVPFCITMLVNPALSSIVALVFAILFIVRKSKSKWSRIVASIFLSVMAAMLIVMTSITGATGGFYSNIESNGVKYSKGDDGKYYVVDYFGDDDVLKIPKVINNKFEVGGVSEEFIENTSCYVLNLEYEFGTDNIETLKVIAFTLKTEETLPIPQREGYTFYGWWSTNNRNTGKQITNEEGKITASSIDKKQDIHAMWFGADYTFISSYKDFNIYNSSKYVLVNDIEMPSNFTPVGGLSGMETQSSRSAFNGVFDGNYHTIKYAITGSRRYNGLFSWIGSRGVVRNLGVNVNINVTFKPTSTQYYAFAGGVAAINDGTIYNCWSTGKIYLESATSVAFSGGIAGASGTNNARTGEIKNCYNLADLETVADDAYAGGILGSAENNAHIVSYCYNRGTIKATGVNSNNTVAGGIISHGRTYAKNCFNAGAILTDYSNKQTLGGIIGFTRDTSSHNNFPTDCVWLKNSNCQASWGVGQYPNDSSGGNNKGVLVITEENMKAISELNGETTFFVLIDGKIHLEWEKAVL